MTTASKWPRLDQPRERLKALGPEALSDSELLALLLGTGSRRQNVMETARQILSENGDLESVVGQGFTALGRMRGIGDAKASRIIAAMELGVRIMQRSGQGDSAGTFSCSMDIYKRYRPRVSLLKHEVFIALALNSKNAVIKEVFVTQGSINECRVEPRDLFRPMIAEAAARTALLHNHPSGDPTPSPHDVALTRRLVRVGTLVGIPVLDHVIIGRNAYASLRDLGLLSGGTEH
jgi:DNA repair protein RadC